MRILLLLLVALTTVGCSQVNISNSRIIDEFEEKLEFDVEDSSQSLNYVAGFVQDLSRREPKSRFRVLYKTGASEFVDELNARFKTWGIAKNRYQVIVADADQQKAVMVVGRYTRIESEECGVMTFSSRDEYRFGCALEHNRNISLVNPIKSEF